MAAVLTGSVGMLCATVVAADEANPVVIELFTSQGCSSCPPADELLTKLAERKDVLPLALHVDYWDYIGWEDNFARPEHTRRQKLYAKLAGRRAIYTPQMVVDGVEQIVGAQPMEVADAIAAHRESPSGVTLSAVKRSDGIYITAPVPSEATGRLLVQVVGFIPREVVEIHRGENAGRTLTYSNVVTDWDAVAEWSGEEPLDMLAPTPEGKAAAVILQQIGKGEIVAAARAR